MFDSIYIYVPVINLYFHIQLTCSCIHDFSLFDYICVLSAEKTHTYSGGWGLFFLVGEVGLD